MIQISARGPQITASTTELAQLAREFAHLHTLKLEGFIAPDLLELIFRSFKNNEFETKTYGEFNLELTLAQNVGVHGLQLLLNHEHLRSVIAGITAAPLRYFAGRIYRLEPKSGHHTDWHDDVHQGRRVGLSINLSRQPYKGGCFEMRNASTRELIRALPNQTLGDAILFRIDAALQHRISALTGPNPKTAFAGWYHDTADFSDLLRSQMSANV